MTSPLHPLFGQVLVASGFKRWNGSLLLVVVLPDGSPGTVPAEVTDVLGGVATETTVSVLSVDGVRRLRGLVDALGPAPRRSRRAAQTRK